MPYGIAENIPPEDVESPGFGYPGQEQIPKVVEIFNIRVRWKNALPEMEKRD